MQVIEICYVCHTKEQLIKFRNFEVERCYVKLAFRQVSPTLDNYPEESDVNGVPSLTLPSISEDDENAHEEGETSPLSPNRSPIHTAQLTNSPRHAKFNLRLQEIHETRNRPRLGGVATTNLAFLRQRVERQRSVPCATKNDSLEDVNTELKTDVENTKNSVERLDNQISSLHQDVATLSMEVRNAIQALQEMTTPTAGGPAQYATHSNPNINRIHGGPQDGILARSTSHPPEMWWEEPLSPPRLPLFHRALIDAETQTDFNCQFREYVLQDPTNVLQILGLDPEILSKYNTGMKKSRSTPDAEKFSKSETNLSPPPVSFNHIGDELLVGKQFFQPLSPLPEDRSKLRFSRLHENV